MKRHFAPGSILCRIGFIAFLLLVTALSLLPMPKGEVLFQHQDKVSHGVTYIFLFGFGWWGWFVNRCPWILALLLIAYGGVIELLQSLTGYRHMDALDVLANMSGIGIGWLLVKTVGGQLYKREAPL